MTKRKFTGLTMRRKFDMVSDYHGKLRTKYAIRPITIIALSFFMLIILVDDGLAQTCKVESIIREDGTRFLQDNCGDDVGKSDLAINISNLPLEVRQQLTLAVADTFSTSAWIASRPARLGDSQWTIVAEEYNREVSVAAVPREELQDAVLAGNPPESVRALSIGDDIRLPPLPPETGSMSRFAVEVSDFERDIAYNVLEFSEEEGWKRYGARRDAKGVLISTRLQPQDEELWLYRNVPGAVFREILKRLGPESRELFQANAYWGPGLDETEPARVQLVQNSNDAITSFPFAATVSQLPNSTIETLRRSQRGEYWILDVFTRRDDGNCSHGTAVRRTAEKVLDALNVGFLKSRIVNKEIDFYANKADLRAYLKDYFGQMYDERISDSILARVDGLSDFSPPAGELHVPLTLLHAYSDEALRPSSNALVMSYSFWVLDDGAKFLTARYEDSVPATLLAASKNQPHDSSVELPIHRLSEPLSTFKNRRREGLIVVGGINENGGVFGLRSNTVTGVTVPGVASGWSTAINCDSANGNSFSTAHMGALLFAARTYWNALGHSVSASEARTRLILATTIYPSLVDKYAAPGIPRANLLLRTEGTFGIRADGEVIEILPTEPGQLQVTDDDGRTTFKGATGSQYGLQLVDDKFYFCDGDSSDVKWKAVDLQSFSLPTSNLGDLSAQDFGTSLVGVISL